MQLATPTGSELLVGGVILPHMYTGSEVHVGVVIGSEVHVGVVIGSELLVRVHKTYRK